jgi:hypothetical protein
MLHRIFHSRTVRCDSFQNALSARLVPESVNTKKEQEIVTLSGIRSVGVMGGHCLRFLEDWVLTRGGDRRMRKS